MFTETILAVFLLGAIVGGAYVWAVMYRPADRQLEDIHTANRRESRQQLYRAQLRREHLGTPYIVPASTGFEKLLADISDNDRWSRKAPADLPDNVRAIGGNS